MLFGVWRRVNCKYINYMFCLYVQSLVAVFVMYWACLTLQMTLTFNFTWRDTITKLLALKQVFVNAINNQFNFRFLFLKMFLAFDFCRFCVVIRFVHPRHNGQWPPTAKDFLSHILSITFIYLNSWERASIFPFECSVLNKGTTGTIFITSLVWHGSWLGIEPGTSRTRSQHYTTRLSRRR